MPTTIPSAAHVPAANKWLIALAVMLATILEVLDMTIATVALDHRRFFLLIPVVFLMRRPQRVGGNAAAHSWH